MNQNPYMVPENSAKLSLRAAVAFRTLKRLLQEGIHSEVVKLHCPGVESFFVGRKSVVRLWSMGTTNEEFVQPVILRIV